VDIGQIPMFLIYYSIISIIEMKKLKIPTFLKNNSKDIWYWVKLRDNTDNVNKNDFFGVMSIPRVQKKLANLYDSDPNSMNPKDVSTIFSDVLRGLDSWKNLNYA